MGLSGFVAVMLEACKLWIYVISVLFYDFVTAYKQQRVYFRVKSFFLLLLLLLLLLMHLKHIVAMQINIMIQNIHTWYTNNFSILHIDKKAVHIHKNHPFENALDDFWLFHVLRQILFAAKATKNNNKKK